MVFQFYMMIVLLNVVIAILNNIYEELVQNSKKEYSLLIYSDYLTYNPNPYLSSIINVPDIMSTFSLFTIPILSYIKSKNLNKMVNIIWYLVYMIIPFISLHLVINLILLCFVYLLTLIQILFLDYKD